MARNNIWGKIESAKYKLNFKNMVSDATINLYTNTNNNPFLNQISSYKAILIMLVKSK